MSGNVAWVNGQLAPREAARVSIDDFGYRYGLACFETMLARNGRVFRLAEHLARLEAGLRLFRAEPPPRADLERAIAETLEANRLTEASVRLSVTPGTGARPALPAPGPPTVTVTADPIGARPPARRLRVSTVRLDASRAWRSAKVAQFAPYLLARVEAEEHGYDDALLLNHEGRVVEASTANVFAVLDDPSGRDVLVTPPLEDGPLPGITRGCILELAAALGIPAREASLTLDDLARATSLLLTNSLGVTVVASVAWEDEGGARREWLPSDGGDSETAGGLAGRVSEAYERLVEVETR